MAIKIDQKEDPRFKWNFLFKHSSFSCSPIKISPPYSNFTFQPAFQISAIRLLDSSMEQVALRNSTYQTPRTPLLHWMKTRCLRDTENLSDGSESFLKLTIKMFPLEIVRSSNCYWVHFANQISIYHDRKGCNLFSGKSSGTILNRVLRKLIFIWRRLISIVRLF